jgi:hypothetical protein
LEPFPVATTVPPFMVISPHVPLSPQPIPAAQLRVEAVILPPSMMIFPNQKSRWILDLQECKMGILKCYMEWLLRHEVPE